MSNGWSRKIFLCPDTERILDKLRKTGIPDNDPARFSPEKIQSRNKEA